MHAYNPACRCYACRNTQQKYEKAKAATKPKPRRNRLAAIQRGIASREEQRASYNDAGPLNWDDRDSEG